MNGISTVAITLSPPGDRGTVIGIHFSLGFFLASNWRTYRERSMFQLKPGSPP